MERTKKPKKDKKPFVITDVEGYPIIQDPAPGTIVTHSGWHPEPGILPGYPADVYIVNGQYEVDGRLSNFWTWRKILKSKSGRISLGPEVHGYGDFRECKNKYDVKILVKLAKK